jgi:uncharacterized protein YhbP (UPF0306 family)
MKTQDMTPGRQGLKPTKEQLYEWLDKQVLCVIATNGGGGYPNAATVGFSQTQALQFVIITDKDSRKAKNIATNQQVAITVTNENDRYTLQLEGEARQLTWDEFEQFSEHHYAKLPFSLPFKDIPGQTPFLITPTHMRFSDVSVRPWELTEVPV